MRGLLLRGRGGEIEEGRGGEGSGGEEKGEIYTYHICVQPHIYTAWHSCYCCYCYCYYYYDYYYYHYHYHYHYFTNLLAFV